MPVVLAEKLCTAIELGTTNTRVRDYADIWTLTRTHNILAADLYTALRATANHRGIDVAPLADTIRGLGVTRAREYTSYLQRLGPDAVRFPQDFEIIVDEVLAFADPLLSKLIPSHGSWKSPSREWTTNSSR